HDDTDLVGPEAQRDRVDLNAPLDRARGAKRAVGYAPLPRRPALAEDLVQIGVADHLEEGLALASRRVETEHRARALVHEQDDVAAVDRDDALDHAVEDRGGLCLLVPEIVDVLAQPRRQAVERTTERARSEAATS